MGSGIDHVLNDPHLPKNIPIIKTTGDDLKLRMREYVVLHSLKHHRNLNKVIEAICTRGKSKIGDKTFVDTLFEISNSISRSENNYSQIIYKATINALNKFRGKECKIGRARMFGEKSKNLDE